MPNLDLVAAVVKAEARGESSTGQTAVISVIMTRAQRSPFYNWSSDPNEVVKQPWQFSCLNEKDPNKKLIDVWLSNPRLYLDQELYLINEYRSGRAPNPVPGADHYLNPKTADKDALKLFERKFHKVADIGNHRFYEAYPSRTLHNIIPSYSIPTPISAIPNRQHVRIIQVGLNNLMGVELATDGIPGPLTTKAWQKYAEAENAPIMVTGRLLKELGEI